MGSIDSVRLVPDGRQSPAEEFEDLINPVCSSNQPSQIWTKMLTEEHVDLSSTQDTEVHTDQSTLGQLTLFSDTHVSPKRAVSPLPISPSGLVPSVRLHTSWKPTVLPPSYRSVSQLLSSNPNASESVSRQADDDGCDSTMEEEEGHTISNQKSLNVSFPRSPYKKMTETSIGTHYFNRLKILMGLFVDLNPIKV
ncbi:unnamed protein product [Echinostoma caproni]|uniref:PDE4_UCR domain-containing protein n=1 Tax=Echinostoma caproni TaxID=27848 RepID=A0A183BGT1_9TREM|nr:unnamed protein product [Echinostoma caproni]